MEKGIGNRTSREKDDRNGSRAFKFVQCSVSSPQ